MTESMNKQITNYNRVMSTEAQNPAFSSVPEPPTFLGTVATLCYLSLLLDVHPRAFQESLECNLNKCFS